MSTDFHDHDGDVFEQLHYLRAQNRLLNAAFHALIKVLPSHIAGSAVDEIQETLEEVYAKETYQNPELSDTYQHALDDFYG